MKVLKWIAIVVVVLLVGIVALIWINLDRIVKKVVETQGTEQLNVATTLDGVSIGLIGGTVDLSNLAIASPTGFSAPQMLSLGGVALDTGGLTRLRNEPIHVASLRIDQPKLVIEQANGKLNFKALMDQLPSHPDKNPPPPTSGENKTVKLIIDDLSVNNAHVVVRAGVPGLSQEIDIPITSIDVKNVGNADGAENGAAIKDVLTMLITQMTARAADSGKLPPEVGALLSGNLSDVKDKLTGVAADEIDKRLEKKLPGIGNLVNQPSSNGQKSGTQGLLNEGLNILGGGTTKP
jgi:uncharacterized protein involved in outer membrane biogenesis